MLPHKEFCPKHICSFGLTEIIIPAVVGFVADAFAGGAAALGALGAADIGAGVAADVGAGVAADVGAGAAAADIGAGALALPEITVTAAAPEAAAAGLGTEAALGGGAALAGAGTEAALAGGLTGAADAALLGGGALAGTAAGLTGGALAGAAPAATEGVTSIGEQFGTAAQGGLTSVAPTTGGALGGAAGGVPSDVLSGATGPLTALSGGQPSTFDTLWQETAGMQPSTDISGQLGGGTQSYAATTEPVFGANAPDWASALNEPAQATNVGEQLFSPETIASGEFTAGTGGPGAFSAPSAVSSVPASTAAEAGTPLAELSGQPAAAGAGPTEIAATSPLSQTATAPTIPASYTPTGGGAGGAAGGTATDISAIQGSTGALPSGTSLTTASGAAPSTGLSSLLSGSNLKTAALLAPVGALGLTLARGQPSIPPAEQEALNNARTVGAFGTSQLTQAQNNQISPAQAAQISTWVQNQTNALYQLFASRGVNPNQSTDYLQQVALIQSQGEQMKVQMVQNMITNGLQATGQVDQTLQAAANQQVASDAAFTSALTSSLSSFGLVAALSARA